MNAEGGRRFGSELVKFCEFETIERCFYFGGEPVGYGEVRPANGNDFSFRGNAVEGEGAGEERFRGEVMGEGAFGARFDGAAADLARSAAGGCVEEEDAI